MTTRNLVPRSANEGQLGTDSKPWQEVNVNKVYASNNVLVFNSVAEMKSSNKVKAGYTIKTLGFYEANDGGGADYVVTDNIGEDEVDEACIITLQKELYVKLLIKDTINVKKFGAKGDGETDDSEAIKKAFNYAYKTNNKYIYIIFPKGKYLLTSNISLNFQGEGTNLIKNIKIIANGSEIFLSGSGFYGFSIIMDTSAEQDTLVEISGFIFSTDNVNRPSAIYTNYACSLNVHNCIFFRTWTGYRAENAFAVNVDKCSFIGCAEPLTFKDVRDSNINNCIATSCGSGYFIDGKNDYGKNGNVHINNCVSILCTDIAVRVKGQYTPFINNLVVETSRIGLQIENCDYGVFSNIFIGPCTEKSIVIKKDEETQSTNDYNIFNNIIIQTEADIADCVNCTFTNILIYGTSSMPSPINFSNVTYSKIDNLNVKNLITSSKYVNFNNCSRIFFTGGTLCLPVKINGTGQFLMSNTFFDEGHGVEFVEEQSNFQNIKYYAKTAEGIIEYKQTKEGKVQI